MSLKEKLLQSGPARKASHWFYNLPQRDQDALKYLSAAVAVVLIYLVIWLPVQNYADRAERAVERESETLAWIKQNEPVARELATRGAAGSTASLAGQSMLSAVGNSAKKFSIELRRFEPEGDSKMRVWLERVPFNQMLLWLDDLEKQFGVQVEQISVDRDDTPGVVTARLTLVLS